MKQSREVNNTDRQEPKDEDDENVDNRPLKFGVCLLIIRQLLRFVGPSSQITND